MGGEWRHAGIHWPTGGEHPNRDYILDNFPGVAGGVVTMLADSARYHYDAARRKGGIVVWRALPRPGRKPAQLGWDPSATAQECLNLWDEQPHYGTEYFTPLNELQFGIESGGQWPGFAYVAEFLSGVRRELRKFLRRADGSNDVRLVFPAWGPDQPYMDAHFDAAEQWVDEAKKWDVIGAHVYSHEDGVQDHYGASNIRRTHVRWRDLVGVDIPIVYTEWNSNHTASGDRDMLEAAGAVCAEDPNCLGYTYYIYETRREGEDQLSIWGDNERLSLFQNPPAAVPIDVPPPIEEPPPPPVEEPPVATVPSDLQQGIDVSNNNGDVDWDIVLTTGIKWAASKISEGTWFRDGWFADNWAEKKRIGIARVAYDFARPSKCSPQEEAQYFLDAFEALGCRIETGDIMALDLEDPDVPVGVDLSSWAYNWCKYVEGALGFKPIVYTSPGYIADHKLYNEPRLGEYGLWAANWRADFPPAPAPWALVAFWQNGVYDSWPGLVGQCDHDFFNGPEESIRKYGKPAAEHEDTGGDPGTPVDPPTAPTSSGADVEHLQTLVGVAYNEDGEILPVLDRIVKGKNTEGKALTKANMQSEAAGAAGFLRSNRP
jgi:GH25 family lysozyme M1 (1,4-beta-N-acetylmuramidase)